MSNQTSLGSSSSSSSSLLSSPSLTTSSISSPLLAPVVQGGQPPSLSSAQNISISFFNSSGEANGSKNTSIKKEKKEQEGVSPSLLPQPPNAKSPKTHHPSSFHGPPPFSLNQPRPTLSSTPTSSLPTSSLANPIYPLSSTTTNTYLTSTTTPSSSMVMTHATNTATTNTTTTTTNTTNTTANYGGGGFSSSSMLSFSVSQSTPSFSKEKEEEKEEIQRLLTENDILIQQIDRNLSTFSPGGEKQLELLHANLVTLCEYVSRESSLFPPLPLSLLPSPPPPK